MAMDSGWRMYLKFKEVFWENTGYTDLITIGYGGKYWVPSEFRKEGATDNKVLTCYIMGDNATYFNRPDIDMEDQLLKELDVVFGDNLATDNFEGMMYMDYAQNPYIRGAYTYATQGMYPKEGLTYPKLIGQSVNGKLFSVAKEPMLLITQRFLAQWKVA